MRGTVIKTKHLYVQWQSSSKKRSQRLRWKVCPSVTTASVWRPASPSCFGTPDTTAKSLPLCPSIEIAEKFDTAKAHSPLHNRGGTTNGIDKAAIEGFILYICFSVLTGSTIRLVSCLAATSSEEFARSSRSRPLHWLV